MGLLDNIGNKLSSMSDDDKRGMALGLASGFAGMSGNPNTASIMAGISDQQKALGARREKTLLTQQTAAQRNRTATMLINMGGDFAKIGTALLRGQIDTDQAMSMHDTIAGKTPNKTFSMMSEEQRIAAGLPVGSYQKDTEGKTYSIGPNGTSIKIITGDEAAPDNEELFKKLGGAEGTIWATYIAQSDKAAATISDINMLGQLLKLSPTGPVTGFFAEKFKGFSTTADAVQGIIARLAPSMRVAGSGSTSDIEVQKMMDSLGSLRSSPEANDLIHAAFKAKLTLDVQRGKIVNQMQNKELTVIEGRKALQELNSKSILSDPLAALLYGPSGSTTAPASAGGTGNIAAANAALQTQLQQQQSQLAALKAKLNLPSQQLSTLQLGPQ
jgi:hypothetical protein